MIEIKDHNVERLAKEVQQVAAAQRDPAQAEGASRGTADRRRVRAGSGAGDLSYIPACTRSVPACTRLQGPKKLLRQDRSSQRSARTTQVTRITPGLMLEPRGR